MELLSDASTYGHISTNDNTRKQGSVLLCVVTDQLNLFPSCTFATNFNDLSYLRSISNNSTIGAYMSALTANRAKSHVKCTMLLRDIYSCCHVQCLLAWSERFLRTTMYHVSMQLCCVVQLWSYGAIAF